MLLTTFKIIVNHPLTRKQRTQAISNWLKWHLSVRLSSLPTVCTFTDKAKILVTPEYSSATGCVFCGLFEFQDMAFLLHFLRESDLFVDVGANVGVYSLLASAEVGAHTIAVEPVPATFSVLQQNIFLNNLSDKVQLNNLGLSSEEGSLHFTKGNGAMNHVSMNGGEDTVAVPVRRLDDLIDTTDAPMLLKIDVEGFETKVIQGGEATLTSDRTKAIIIELNGFGQRYGFDDQAVHDKLESYGFRPYKYDPFTRALTELPGLQRADENSLYLKDVDFVRNRIKTARTYQVKGQTF